MQLIEKLEKFGLSRKEAKIYVVLLELGPSVVQEIAKKSEINRKGVFTQRRIPKGELIRFMRGREISVSQLKKRYELGKERENLTDPFQIAKRKYFL